MTWQVTLSGEERLPPLSKGATAEDASEVRIYGDEFRKIKDELILNKLSRGFSTKRRWKKEQVSST